MRGPLPRVAPRPASQVHPPDLALQAAEAADRGLLPLPAGDLLGQGALSVYDSQNVFTSLTVGIASPNQLQEILNERRIVKNLEVYPAINSVSLDFTDPRRW